MSDEVLCPTCQHNQPQEFYIADVLTVASQCWHKVASFPTAYMVPVI